MNTRIPSVVRAVAGAAFLLGALGAQAQDKKVRVQIAGAFPSSRAIVGTAELRLVKMIRDSSGGSMMIRRAVSLGDAGAGQGEVKPLFVQVAFTSQSLSCGSPHSSSSAHENPSPT